MQPYMTMKDDTMPLKIVDGDPLLTTCPVLGIGYNAKGRTETTPFAMAAMRRYPAAFSTYTRQARKDRQQVGTAFGWNESKPRLLFMTVRASSVGATRLRYVQQIALTLVRDYRLLQLDTLAIAPLGDQYEMPEILRLFENWFAKSKLTVIAYNQYEEGVKADETL